ncbi:nebulette-like isoform X7 [Syngnathus acus]|uniref:nebulette-like isoform X7 n=1 Tax=Syngnathus acus TaxID=161584 RepID=UPI001885C2FF|nr:nebulette-like isoform X7 [Syngnathus acus]
MRRRRAENGPMLQGHAMEPSSALELIFKTEQAVRKEIRQEETFQETVTTFTSHLDTNGRTGSSERVYIDETAQAKVEREDEKEDGEEVVRKEASGEREQGGANGSEEPQASSGGRPVLPDPGFNRRCSLLASEVKYKEDFEKMKGQSLFVPAADLIHAKNISAVVSESKYKQEGREEASLSLYSLLPDTPQIQRAKEVTQLQSEVKYKENMKMSSSLYSLMPETNDTHFVKELTDLLSQNKYKEEVKKELSSTLYSQLPETSEMHLAKSVHEFQKKVHRRRQAKSLRLALLPTGRYAGDPTRAGDVAAAE